MKESTKFLLGAAARGLRQWVRFQFGFTAGLLIAGAATAAGVASLAVYLISKGEQWQAPFLVFAALLPLVAIALTRLAIRTARVVLSFGLDLWEDAIETYSVERDHGHTREYSLWIVIRNLPAAAIDPLVIGTARKEKLADALSKRK